MGLGFSRADLEGLVERYLDALVGHAANRLPLAGGVRYTENGVRLDLDDGLWGTASGAGRYRIVVPDVEGQQVGYMGVVEEAGQLICVTTRLRLQDGGITEIETLATHPSFAGGGLFGGGAKALEEMGTPHPAFLEPLAPEDRLGRRALIEIANSYFSGLERNTGRYPVPFDPQCQRRENGIQTTSNPDFAMAMSEGRPERGDQPNMMLMGPKAQLETGGLAFVTAIRNRRFPCVDESTGNVLAFGYFDHDGRSATVTWADGVVRPSPVRMPMTFQIAELFKVQGGRLRQIEANLTAVPYGMSCACWDE